MSVNNVQFAVACHLLTVLAYREGGAATSRELSESVMANPTFVRRTLTRLAKAGLVIATRGVTGACKLARPPEQISLLQIFQASEASPVFSVHTYPVQESCVVSVNIKDEMDNVLKIAQAGVEDKLSAMSLKDLLRGIRNADSCAEAA